MRAGALRVREQRDLFSVPPMRTVVQKCSFRNRVEHFFQFSNLLKRNRLHQSDSLTVRSFQSRETPHVW